jgi:hypothetical protein
VALGEITGLATLTGRTRSSPHALEGDRCSCLVLAFRLAWRHESTNADELIAIVAKRLVEHLERSGFVVMKRQPINGSAAAAFGDELDPFEPCSISAVTHKYPHSEARACAGSMVGRRPESKPCGGPGRDGLGG